MTDIIVTSIERQKEVYAAIKDNPELVIRWKNLMKCISGMDDETLALIKGETNE